MASGLRGTSTSSTLWLLAGMSPCSACRDSWLASSSALPTMGRRCDIIQCKGMCGTGAHHGRKRGWLRAPNPQATHSTAAIFATAQKSEHVLLLLLLLLLLPLLQAQHCPLTLLG